jgi:hypothetical protein
MLMNSSGLRMKSEVRVLIEIFEMRSLPGMLALERSMRLTRPVSETMMLPGLMSRCSIPVCLWSSTILLRSWYTVSRNCSPRPRWGWRARLRPAYLNTSPSDVLVTKRLESAPSRAVTCLHMAHSRFMHALELYVLITHPGTSLLYTCPYEPEAIHSLDAMESLY